jgi:hypothetical protein
MAIGLKVGDLIYVPATRVGITDAPAALVETKVEAKQARTVTVIPGANCQPVQIATAFCHRRLGVALLLIGDYDTERSLLDPLVKSLLHYLRLLLSDDTMVKVFRVRSLPELMRYWAAEHKVFSHVILVGHGRPDGVRFGDQWIGPDALADGLSVLQAGFPRTIISLACATGRADFARPFSKHKVCEELIAPFGQAHGAIAATFSHAYLTHHLLEGRTPKVAFNRSCDAIPGGTVFRYWEDGRLVGAAAKN